MEIGSGRGSLLKYLGWNAPNAASLVDEQRLFQCSGDELRLPSLKDDEGQ